MNSRILLPIEGVQPTLVHRIALPLQKSGAEIVVVQVLDRKARGLLSSLADTSGLQGKARDSVDSVVDEVKALGIPARGDVVEGPAATTIVEIMEREEALLVVMATHGRVGWSRLAKGSVTEHVMRHTTAPILVVPLVDRRVDEEALPAQWTFSRALIPTDGSAESLEVVNRLANLRRLFDPQVSLLHVVASGADERVVGAGRAFLQVAREACCAEGLSPSASALRVGDPAEQILDYCESHGHDFIAMTTHGATGFTRLVLGSVTESVVRDSLLPVLVVRSVGGAADGSIVDVGSEPVVDAS